MRGLFFEIKNVFGKQLSNILKGIVDPSWFWSIDLVESYRVENGKLTVPLFDETIMDGQSFLNHISDVESYLIFTDIKAFPTKESIVEVKVYEDFKNSSCQLSLIVVDQVYVWILAKDQQLIQNLIKCAEANGYTNIKAISDGDDDNTILNVWG
ncbi:DUF2691 family protein [Sporosarcina highlanderae]|uniref:DUF2691 family protein n=1 Tax=Sporosarcina highlanderae TaxID=3035916 RepID=A0ABT8JMU5_9BACL|nr:DUF2691 family protein [Sporosarcina highlanderae]MDN4606468.1 DUF2691 family protein [Sporosarcina highlanderae]